MLYQSSTLYRQSGDRVQQWRSWARADADSGAVLLGTEFGKVGGALRVTEREVKEAGNKGTLEAQATHQAQKKWRDKQAKEGYRASEADAAACLHDGRPAKRAKTDAAAAAAAAEDAPVLPMLANVAVIKDGGLKGISFPCSVQPKIDGFRCVARVTGGAKLFSRRNVEYVGFASMRAAVDTLAPKLPRAGFGSGRFYLDGEFFVDADDFGALSSKIKKGQHRPEYDLPELRFRVFDCFDLDHMDTPFTERFELLCDLGLHPTSVTWTLEPAARPDGIELLQTERAASLDEVRAKMAEYLADGHEGLMVREKDSPYVLRKRSKHLLKLKEFTDSEFEIVGHKEGAGEDAGTVVWQCVTPDGEHTFWVRPMGTREHRAELLAAAEANHGRLLCVKYQELSPDGVPRFPVGKAIREPFDL